MSKPSTSEVLRMLIERPTFCQQKAREAEDAGQPGLALYYKILAADATVLYAWLSGDDVRTMLAENERRQLETAIKNLDAELLDYRVARARVELERVA